MQKQVLHNQSLLDIAIQEDGSVLAVFDWAIKNGLSITDDLAPRQKLTPPISNYRNEEVSDYFKGKNQIIATALFELPTESVENYEFPQGEFPISF